VAQCNAAVLKEYLAAGIWQLLDEGLKLSLATFVSHK
jgi:hypothetical protein